MKYNYFPAVSNLRSSLKCRSREYILENSLHGVPYIADPSRPKWERGIWFLLTMASIGATFLIIVTIWHKFQEEPTLTGLDMDVANLLIPFPQIILCFDGNQLNYSDINESEKQFYESMYEWRWDKQLNITKETKPKTMRNLRESFLQWSPECSDTFNGRKNLGIFGEELMELQAQKFEKVVTPVGICCRYIIREPYTLTDDPWSFGFTSTLYPIKLYLMDPSDIGPSRHAYPLIKLTLPGSIRFMVYITYSTPELQMLSRYQRQCCYAHEQSTYNNCQLKCLSDDILNKCWCLPWFLALNGEKECTFSAYSCVAKAYQIDSNCDCLLPCNFTAYQPTVFMQERNVTNMVQMLWPRTLFRREIRFGYLDLVVSFGGIAGLFLGYSLLTSVEFFYFFGFRTYCGAVLDTSRKNNIIQIRERKVKIPPKPEIKFIYYDYVE